jgi:hypothetical protein
MSMRTIAERNLLLRLGVDLPGAIKLRTEEFREGWCRVKTLNAKKLERKIRAQAWSFVRMADVSLKSGVGETSQVAIARALALALRTISANFNAVEVENIHLTQYPWFFLARVRICPYRIQHNGLLALADESEPIPVAHRQRALRRRSGGLYTNIPAAMSQFSEILISSPRLESKLR